jgi:hypothetical protein
MVKVWRTSHTALDDIVTAAIEDWTSDKAKVLLYSAAAAAALLQPTGSFGDGVPHAQRRKFKEEVTTSGEAALRLWRRTTARAQRLSRVGITEKLEAATPPAIPDNWPNDTTTAA